VHGKKGESSAECFSSYMPSMDDVGHLLQIEYTPIPSAKTKTSPNGEFSPTPPVFARAHVAITKYPVQVNEQTTMQVGDAFRRGVAEFVVVCEADKWQGGDVYCTLEINKQGIKAHQVGGIQALIGRMTGDGIKTLPFSTDTDPRDVATVVLPSELLQVTLRGDNGSKLTVQAESPSMRDAIVSAARKFAAMAKRGTRTQK